MTTIDKDRGPLPWAGREWMIAVGLLLAVFVVILVWQQIYRSGTATRQDVAVTMRDLQPACRPIVGMRIRDRLLREGRPMTRRDLEKDAAGLKHCEEINDQISGLTDA